MEAAAKERGSRGTGVCGYRGSREARACGYRRSQEMGACERGESQEMGACERPGCERQGFRQGGRRSSRQAAQPSTWQDSRRQKFKQASKRAFDAQAATYDEEAQGSHARLLYPHMIAEVAAAKPRRALDMGCGTGALTELVAEAVPDCSVAGVDLSEAMLAVAYERLGNRVDLHVADCERLPFADGLFDVVFCNDSFHHYPDPEKAAFEAWRVLAPGGVFVVGDCWAPAPVRAVMNALMPYGSGGDVRIYSESELKDIFGSWFASVEWRRVGRTACIARAGK